MSENYLMGLAGVAIGIFIFVMILRMKFKGYSISLPFEKGYRLKDIFAWAIRDSEMIKRLIITAGILVILRFAFLIPLPGLDFSVLWEFFRRFSKAQGDMGIIGILSSGAFEKLTIFGLGLAPFFSSCILIQLASIFIPALRKLSFNGESGRERISKYTYLLTIILCIIQSYFISLWLARPVIFEGMRLVAISDVSFRFITMLAMTASVVFLLFVADIITRYGVGNGVAVIAVSYFPLGIFAACNQVFFLRRFSQLYFSVFLLIVLFCGFIYIIFNITNRAKAIEIQGQKSDKISIYFRPSMVGRAPLIYVNSIILLPATLASFANFPWTRKFNSMFMRDSVIYSITYVILIFVFTYLYAWIVFSQKYIHGLMNKFGYSVAGTDNSAEDYLDNNMSKVLIITGLFLSGVTLVPDLVMYLLKIPYLAATLIGGSGVMMAVGVFSDIVNQLVFFKNKKDSGIKEWTICYVAFDEIEARIKSEFLKNKGIPALVEPLRFSWGMPIRTMVDQYRIYTPIAKQEEARSLIK